MSKYLLCALNDENYTQPDFKVFSTMEDALKCAHDWCMEAADDDYMWASIETTQDEGTWDTRKSIQYGDNFYVTEVKQIKENVDYVAVWHHAYEGVDFKVIAQDTKEECIKAIEDDMKRVIDELELDESDYDDSTVDTGNEWEHWEIVKVKEV